MGGAAWGLLLAPGSGAGSGQSSLVAIDKIASGLGGRVRRMDFPYRLAGRKAPDKPEVLVASVVAEASNLGAQAGARPQMVFLGGRSMGGRMCSMAVAEGLPAAGLVLVSYPLHPPGRPEKLRTGHFERLQVPCLFVSGTRDAFGTPAELEAATAAIPGPVTFFWLDGADHSLRGRDSVVASRVGDWLSERLSSSSSASAVSG